MKIFSIQSAEFYGFSSCVIYATTKDPRLDARGIDAQCQLKDSEILLIKETGQRGWQRIRPEAASPAQRVICTACLTILGIGTGAMFGGPVGSWVGGVLCIKIGLDVGGFGRIAPVLIMSKDAKMAYVGSLPLWQVKCLERILEANNGDIEILDETEVSYATH